MNVSEIVRAPGSRPLVRLLGLLGCGQFADALTAVCVLAALLGDEHGVDGDRLLTTIAVAALPHLVATPLSAGIVDRFDRVRLMTVVQLVRSAATALLLVSVGVGVLPTAWLAAAVLMCSTRLVHTLRGAVLPNVTAVDALVPVGTATLLTGLAFGGAGAVVGVAIRGHDVVTWIAPAVHLVAALGFGAWSFDLGGRAGRARRGERSARVFAASVACHAPRFGRPVGLIILHRVLLGASFATLVTWLAEAAGASGGYVTVAGVTSTATVVGIASAPIAVATLGHRGVEVGTTAASATLMFAAARLDSAAVGLALAAVAFGLFQFQRSATESALQGGVGDQVRGRVLAVYDVLYNVAYFGGAAVAVGAGFASSPARTMSVLGAAYAVCAVTLVRAGSAVTSPPMRPSSDPVSEVVW